jgi:hypothetical protein
LSFRARGASIASISSLVGNLSLKLGEACTIVGIDLTVQHRPGSVRVRFDDGRELDFAAIAHGLTPIGRDDAR